MCQKNSGKYKNGKEDYIAKSCLYCGTPILLSEDKAPTYTRLKNYCSRSCVAKFYRQRNINNLPKAFLDERTRIRATESSIREHARRKVANIPKVCMNCNYSKFVEVCHIKAISSYPEDALLKEVNDVSNLVILCRNCHWEFDHGDLKINNLLEMNFPGASP